MHGKVVDDHCSTMQSRLYCYDTIAHNAKHSPSNCAFDNTVHALRLRLCMCVLQVLPVQCMYVYCACVCSVLLLMCMRE